MGWQGYTQIDSQEANDKVGQSTSLQTNAVIQGNLDNANDLDFFSYAVEPDQVKLNLRFSASEQFVLETWSGSSWVQLPNNQLGAYSVTPNTTVNFLVRATADNPPPASAQYALAMAAPGTATSIDNLKAWNNERLSKLLLLASDEPPTTSTSVQAHKLLNFKGWLKDASGNPAPFANVSIAIKTLGSDIEYSTLQADEKGMINGSVSLSDTCVANDDRKRIHNRVYSGTPTNPSMWWDIHFSIGNFAISVGDNNYGSFYHICKERLVETCFYDKNYSTGMTELKCF